MLDIRDISKVVKELRAILSLSQEELAAKLGVSFATVNRWENGKIVPGGKAIKAIQQLIEETGLDLVDLDTFDNGTTPYHKRRRKQTKENLLSTKSMEQMLWSAACSIRGEKDAPKFKDYILPLIFIKRLSDVFEDEIMRLAEKYGEKEIAESLVEDDHALVRFYLPKEARWSIVNGREQFKWPKNRKPKTLGEQITLTMRAIVKENSRLSGVIDIVDYNETRNNEREISDSALAGIIEIFSDPKYRLGLNDVDRKLLELILKSYKGGPVGIDNLAAGLIEDVGTIVDVYEPYLMKLGFLKRTPRGRVITEAGKKHLGEKGDLQPKLV